MFTDDCFERHVLQLMHISYDTFYFHWHVWMVAKLYLPYHYSRYSQALVDCQQCYFSQREQLLGPSISSTINDLATKHVRDHCALVSNGFWIKFQYFHFIWYAVVLPLSFQTENMCMFVVGGGGGGSVLLWEVWGISYLSIEQCSYIPFNFECCL